jgi:phosphate transport system substrate-binding protein
VKFLKTLVAAGLVAASTLPVRALDISGAGATFPYPIYAKWADAYKKETGNGMNYQSIGSGGGIKQIQSKTVTFGASDMPLKPEDLVKSGLVQFPTVVGGDVPVVNLDGVKAGDLKLDGTTLAKIFLGEITSWDDAAIAKLNPQAKLPKQAIVVVHRSDGSGTTFIYSSYLSLESAEWKSKVGAGTAVAWPTGLGGKGSQGVDAFTKQTLGSIGYVEYAYALQNHMNYALMRNKAGAFVAPTAAAFKSAAAGVDWNAVSKNGFNVILLDEPGAQSWPISGATFVLVHKNGSPNAKAVLNFYDWAFTNGDADAESLDYVPLPAKAKALIRQSWAAVH